VAKNAPAALTLDRNGIDLAGVRVITRTGDGTHGTRGEQSIAVDSIGRAK
jgi:hypothetical protein